MIQTLFFTVVLFCLLQEAYGHGMMMDPPNRSSLWRFNDSFPINYNDNENFCGGVGIQWEIHQGKCGVCGDNYGDPVPRKNENTGTYGLGKVVAQYKAGSVINVTILLTANHKGWFSYSLCELTDPSEPETDECFQKLKLEDGSETFTIDPSGNSYLNHVQLPNKVCERCVLRWHYKTGNSWGICENGEGGIGCGPQETYRSCSDIAMI